MRVVTERTAELSSGHLAHVRQLDCSGGVLVRLVSHVTFKVAYFTRQ